MSFWGSLFKSFLGSRSISGVTFGRRFKGSFLGVSSAVFGTLAPDPPDLPGVQTLAPVPGQGNHAPAFRMTLVGKDKLPQRRPIHPTTAGVLDAHLKIRFLTAWS